MLFNDFNREAMEINTELHLAFDRFLRKGWYILGTEVSDFETECASYLGTKNVIGVANGLEALQISLMALGIKNGDEVITTPVSAMATTLAIIAVGAKPVFVDVDDNGLINTKLIESSITPNTKAVIPVHLYGNAVSPKSLDSICKKHNLYLIEDAAQAHGSSSNGKKLGTFGDIGCFSFYPTKNLGALGDAGAIVTDNDLLAEKCRQLRDYGQVTKYNHKIYGLNSRLDELQAAFLRIKLKKLDEWNNRRAKNADIYTDNIDQSIASIVAGTIGTISNNHQFVVKSQNRDSIKRYLEKNGIPTLIHYPLTIPDQPMFEGKYSDLSVPKARNFVREVLSLPCSPFHTAEEIHKVVDVINAYSKND